MERATGEPETGQGLAPRSPAPRISFPLLSPPVLHSLLSFAQVVLPHHKLKRRIVLSQLDRTWEWVGVDWGGGGWPGRKNGGWV